MPCHNRIRGATIRPDIAPANIVITRVMNIRRTQIVIIVTPTFIFQGMITRPIAIRPSKIK
jgi:hypothetical protein